VISGEEKNSQPLQGIEPRSPVTILTEPPGSHEAASIA